MKRTIYVVLGAMVVVLTSSFASAQWYRGNLKDVLKRLEEDTDHFSKSLDSDLDHSALNGTPAEDEINRYVHEFEEATDYLKDKFDDQRYAPNLAREVLVPGRSIDGFMRRYKPRGRSMSD